MKFWQIDAFTSEPFKGNPAAVVILDKPLPDDVLQNIAIEMNQSETAFIEMQGAQPHLRWFTTSAEVDLCGHATMASAHVWLSLHPDQTEVTFTTKFVGPLSVSKSGPMYTMNFPSRPGEPVEVDSIPNYVLQALSPHPPKEAYMARDLMLVYDDEAIVREMQPDVFTLKKFQKWIIVTSRSKDFDFISRFFCASDTLSEDPVTGSAHCTSTPYWARVLGKRELHAYQASARGGHLNLELNGDRVFISGEAVTVLQGDLIVS